jgi:hypothetical protein
MFVNNPKVSICEESGKWKLEESLIFALTDYKFIIVSQGFITDLASIPKIFQSFVSVNGKHRRAAIIHDWLYVTQKVTRKEADLIFLNAMKIEKVSKAQILLMYLAVRVGGYFPWRKNAACLKSNRLVFLKSYGIQ